MIATGRIVAHLIRADLGAVVGDVVLVPVRLRPSAEAIVSLAPVTLRLRDGVLDAWLALGDWAIDLGVGRGAVRVTVTEAHTAASPLRLDV